jgi:dimeric dUTPase (all-alpha-NTP-PPase superfamily)
MVSDKLKHQILQMLKLQEEMNTKVHPEWRQQNYQYYRAVWTECAELLDHHGWKWWKKQDPDMEQIKLEIVDIWHFGMSMHLMERDDLDNLAGELAEQFTFGEPEEDFLAAVEQLAKSVLEKRFFDIPYFHQLMTLMKMSNEELFKQYVGKNVLNFFRQNHGYKDGTYIKIWDGREDNEHLAEILNQSDSESQNFREIVYQALEQRYPKQ